MAKRKFKDTSGIDWTEIFYYDESSPSCLCNKIQRGARGTINQPAGYINPTTDYWTISVNKVHFSAHRVVYELVTGQRIGDNVLDHIDGDITNNKIANLRIIPDESSNCMNRKKRSDNISGITGVSRTSNGRGNYYWTAHWSDEFGNNLYKTFSVLQHGEEAAKQLAIQKRSAEIERLRLLGLDYTDRHGL